MAAQKGREQGFCPDELPKGSIFKICIVRLLDTDPRRLN